MSFRYQCCFGVQCVFIVFVGSGNWIDLFYGENGNKLLKEEYVMINFVVYMEGGFYQV